MFGISRKKALGGPQESAPIWTTERKDWPKLGVEIYGGVVDGCRFGIGLLTKEHSLLGSSISYRLNQSYSEPGVLEYVRRKFKPAHFDHIFQSGDGLIRDPQFELYKVASKNLGLPANCLVCPIENPSDAKMRSVLVFGGQRLEGQLESRLKMLASVLGASPGLSPLDAPTGNLPGAKSTGELINALKDLNVKRLFDYDLNTLSEIVNGLEESKDDLPKRLKPTFMAVSQFILGKRLGR